MSLFVIIVSGLLALGAMWKLGRLSTGAVFLVGAALSLGLVGYALQGSPALPASPAVKSPEAIAASNPSADPSNAFLGQFGGEAEALKQADAYFRINRPDLAARVIKLAIAGNRNSPALWTGLGNALVAHGQGFLSPSAEFAYKRAMRIAPGFPGSLYFYAVALTENGRIDEARPLFKQLLAAIPPDVPVRKQLISDMLRLGVLKPDETATLPPVK